MMTTNKTFPTRRALGSSLAGLLLSAGALASAAEAPVLLKVEGAVKTPLALTAEDLARMPRSTAQFERDGEPSTY